MYADFCKELKQVCEHFKELKIVFHYLIWETDFLRFFQSQTNYNISKKNVTLNTTIYKNKKSFSFEINNPTIEQVKNKIIEAMEIIDQLPQDTDFVDIENNLEKTAETDRINMIEKLSLSKKVEILDNIATSVEPHNFSIFGTFLCNYQTMFIINSNGVYKRSQSSPFMLELKAVSNETQVTVLESFGSETIENFSEKLFIDNLLKKVSIAKGEIVDINPGKYQVILAPRCIGEYFMYLAHAGMTAESLDHKSSFFEGKLNQKIFPENISLYDDPHYPGNIKTDYNYDGHLYSRVALIENGIFKNFMIDNYYGNKMGLEKNGAEGNCLVMKEGNKNLDDMIAGIEHGVYISSLHYMNFINQKETSITGLTRDGTFLIERGKLKKVVNNLRFTVKISDVIENTEEIENKLYSVPFSDNYGEFSINCFSMPHVKVSNFFISSSTKTI